MEGDWQGYHKEMEVQGQEGGSSSSSLLANQGCACVFMQQQRQPLLDGAANFQVFLSCWCPVADTDPAYPRC